MIHTLQAHGPVMSVAFSPDGHRLAAAIAIPGEVKVWDATIGQVILTLKGHTGMVTSVAFSPDGLLASASNDQTVKVWDVATGRLIHTLKGHHGKVNSVAFSPDGRRLASASLDQTVQLWNPAKGQETRTLKGHTARVMSVGFSPNSRRLASASEDRTIKVWDIATGRVIRTLKGYSDPMGKIAFGLGGRLLTCMDRQGRVKTWDVETGKEDDRLGAAPDALNVAVSPDRKRVASANLGESGTVLVQWNILPHPQVIHTLRGHSGVVNSVAYSPDGQRLASCSDDQTVKVWDTATGLETLTLTGHVGSVECVVFSPDGHLLASASEDGTVKVWDAPTGTRARGNRAVDWLRNNKSRGPRLLKPEPARPSLASHWGGLATTGRHGLAPGSLALARRRARRRRRTRSRLGLIATVLEDVLRVRRDPHVGQERLQVHLVRRQGDQ